MEKSRLTVKNTYTLNNKVAIITGGAGLLGMKHAEAIAEMGGFPVLLDINQKKASTNAKIIRETFGVECIGLRADITNRTSLEKAKKIILEKFNRIDILINNAANNPKVENGLTNWSRFENFPLEVWQQDLSVSLTGAFLSSQVFGTYMAQNKHGGVILNICSDLGVIAPDQRIYRKVGLKENEQPVKPVTYSIVKHGILGLTKYLATYWADYGIRVNAVSPGGIYANQDPKFVRKLAKLIPLGRMADQDEYKATIVYLVSDASSYMTGANLIIDGGRTCW